MTRQAVLIAIALLAVLASVVAIVTWSGGGSREAAVAASSSEAAAGAEGAASGELQVADLYFPGKGGLLHPERRELPPSGGAAAPSAGAAERLTVVVETLLAGPQSAGFQAPLPAGVSVRKVYLSEDGLALVDLKSAGGALPPASGSSQEMLTVYSLVNTVLLNFTQLDRVVLLWNSRQLETFAGHVDTMRPLLANTDLIAQSP